MYQKFFKRLFDMIISLFFLILFFPIIVLILVIVWINIGFPIFVQKRPGLNNKIFLIYKFKTLRDMNKDLSIKQRQTKVGNFLRQTGLDELPQLINILENKMSLIGPRPLLVEYLKYYKSNEKKRHMVKPGITGLAQVYPGPEGNKMWKRSIRLDLYYVKNISFLLDLKILLRTVKIVYLKKKQFNDFSKFN